MRFISRTAFVLVSAILAASPALPDNTQVPPSFRKQAIQAQGEEIQNSAVTSVPVDASGQPGYIQSNARGNLAAYPSAESYSTFQLNETRAQLLMSPAFLTGSGIQSRSQFSVAVRYQVSPRPWPESTDSAWHIGPFPLSLAMELGAIPPTNSGSLTNAQPSNMSNPSTFDSPRLQFNYQAHLALIDELPHGKQTWIVPEIGAGVSLVSTKIENFSSTQGSTPVPPFNIPDVSFYHQKVINETFTPYLSMGLHLFPEHFLSLNLRGSYLQYNFPDSLQIPASTGEFGTPLPGHTLPISAPSSSWVLEATLQMKLVWPTLTHTPLIPQLMPPWLLPSYTTDEISPWVASTEVTQRYNQPGRPPVGNVMFQYKNKWVKKVEIIGDFNDWAAEPMIKDRSGIWVCVKDLPVGKFRYNYILDGKKEILDPWNKNVDANSREHGSSIVAVK